MKNQIQDKLSEIRANSGQTISNSFLTEWDRVKGDKTKEFFFAQKWGLDNDMVPGYDDGEAELSHSDNEEYL